MRYKLPVLLILIVLIPLGATGWLGLRMAEDERRQIESGFERLLQQRLEDIASPLAATVDELKRSLLDITTNLENMNPADLRGLTWRYPGVEQFFMLDAVGKLIFPDPGGDLTKRESAFIERTRMIWREQSLFSGTLAQAEMTDDGGGFSSAPNTAVSDASESSLNSGWFSWHWGNGLNLLLWQRMPDGSIVGAEIDRLILLSDLIAQLPDSGPDRNQAGRIRLLDARDKVLYQWGGFEPEPNALPLAQLHLNPPLESWKLAYYEDVNAIPSGDAARFQIILGVVVLSLVVLMLLIYLYLELTRAMREAGQRVNFVNQVSHELKTPLTNIRMYAELMQQDLDDTQPAQQKLAVIVDETSRLSRLIGNVLGFARGQRKALNLRPVSDSLDRCVTEVLNAFIPNLEQRGIQIETSLNAKDTFSFDPDAVAQIVGNLLNNVEKYASAGGYLKIATCKAENSYLLDLCDHGPGIPARMRKRIFKPFFRIRNDLTEGVSGTGIGLSISRDLARLHGGDLTLEPSGQGACFRLRLPGAPA